MKIAHYTLDNNVLLAPMAGISDLPFRSLCKQFGAGLTISEMVDSNPHLRDRRNTYRRLQFSTVEQPRCVQIVGHHPQEMADTAQFCVEHGAQIIDINMGCPARKICHKQAGSALLKDETLVEKILSAVVHAVNVPVTLKIRTGWNPQHRNAMQIAKIAETSGIQALTIHGRTRSDGYDTPAEYDTIKQVKKTVTIPVIANGDINSREKLLQVLQYTKADGAMIGRAAWGKPWIFSELLGRTSNIEPSAVIHQHIQDLHQFYGEKIGVLMARKHITWYWKDKAARQSFYPLQTAQEQLDHLQNTDDIKEQEDRSPFLARMMPA